MTVCDDLRLGGVLNVETGLSGGTSINGTELALTDWSGVFGHGGIAFTPVEVSGRSGGLLVGDGLPRHRYPTLHMRIKDQGECDASDTPADRLLENTDTFLTLLSNPNGNYLEVDLPDATSRFIQVFALTAAPINQPRATRTMVVPLYSPDPYWTEGGISHVDSVSGVDSIDFGGSVNIYNATINFAGDGTLTHLDNDWAITVDGSTGTVHVDLGARTVTMGGDHADQVLAVTNRLWGWFSPGTNNLQSDVAVSVSWRNQFA
jgi:phage-related protein